MVTSVRAKHPEPEQLSLVKVAPKPSEPKPLTDRQAEALTHLQAAGRDGLTGAKLGRLMGAAPLYCHSTGLELLRALKKKHHARQTTGGIYIALELPRQPSPLDGPIPF